MSDVANHKALKRKLSQVPKQLLLHAVSFSAPGKVFTTHVAGTVVGGLNRSVYCTRYCIVVCILRLTTYTSALIMHLNIHAARAVLPPPALSIT